MRAVFFYYLTLQKDGVAPDIVTYNTCVTITGQAGRLDEALELLRKASEEAGLTLDVVSYRAALGGLRREKRWEAAVKLLGDMQRRGVGPDEVCVRCYFAIIGLVVVVVVVVVAVV